MLFVPNPYQHFLTGVAFHFAIEEFIVSNYINREVTKMAVSYKKLWKLLIDKDMMKKELAQKANVSNYTLAKMNKGENVTTDVLVRICKALECNLDDIMELVDE